MYETIHHGLAPRAAFLRRLVRHAAAALGLVGGSLAIGVVGYHLLEHLPWIDSLLNASMLMGGMGPVDALHTTAGKLFASIYALYCGLVLLIAAGVIFAPVLHRLMHRFHLAGESDSK